MEKLITQHFSMFEVPTQEFYQRAKSHFVNCSLIVERRKSDDGTAIYEVEGVESDVRAFLETIKHY
jgi:hypothetical protein